MDYRSDGQLNLEARSLMMMIPDNTGAIGQGLTHSSNIEHSGGDSAGQHNSNNPVGVSTNSNNFNKRQLWSNIVSNTYDDLRLSQQQISGGFPQNDSSDLATTAKVNPTIFDDETNDILQSYPKTTTGQENNAISVEERDGAMQRTIDLNNDIKYN